MSGKNDNNMTDITKIVTLETQQGINNESKGFTRAN